MQDSDNMAKQGPPRKIGKFTPLSLTSALQKAVPQRRKQRRFKDLQKLFAQEEICQNPNDVSLVDFLKSYPKAAQALQQKFNLRWVVIQNRRFRDNKKVQLLYDGSHAILQQESSPVHYFLLDTKHCLKLHTVNTPQGMPLLTFAHYKKKRIQHQAPLWQLLGYTKNPSELTKDPQTTEELQTFFNHYTPPKTRVTVCFVHDPVKNFDIF